MPHDSTTFDTSSVPTTPQAIAAAEPQILATLGTVMDGLRRITRIRKHHNEIRPMLTLPLGKAFALEDFAPNLDTMSAHERLMGERFLATTMHERLSWLRALIQATRAGLDEEPLLRIEQLATISKIALTVDGIPLSDDCQRLDAAANMVAKALSIHARLPLHGTRRTIRFTNPAIRGFDWINIHAPSPALALARLCALRGVAYTHAMTSKGSSRGEILILPDQKETHDEAQRLLAGEAATPAPTTIGGGIPQGPGPADHTRHAP